MWHFLPPESGEDIFLCSGRLPVVHWAARLVPIQKTVRFLRKRGIPRNLGTAVDLKLAFGHSVVGGGPAFMWGRPWGGLHQ